jgi:hypothetical protein
MGAAPATGEGEALEDEDTTTPECTPCPLIVDDWGRQSPQDEWCFLCLYSPTDKHMHDNPHYAKLVGLFHQNDGRRQIQVCRVIQAHYNAIFRPITKKKWTLRSIRQHQEEDLGLSDEAMKAELKRTTYKLLCDFRTHGLCETDVVTGERRINITGARAFIRSANFFLRLLTKS